MKKIYALVTGLLLTITAGAQTLNVQVGNVTYQFPASQTGDMTYADGTTLTIMGKAFAISDISSMTVDNTEVTDNLVQIAYSGTSATVTVAGNVAQYVEPAISGAYVSIAQSNTDAVDDDEIIYQLSGTTTDGQFALSGSYKCTVALAGVSLTCATGAAIDITNKKRIQLSVKNGTENTLTDCAGGSQKGCVYSKGQLQLQGKGTLTVVGNTAHAIKSADYITVKNLTLNITGSVSDGINCNGYFQMKSGTVTMTGIGDDGIQCDLDGTTSTGETTDHEDEDSGNVYLEGGTLTVTVSAAAAKGVKAEGDLNVSDGIITITATGNDGKAIKSDGTLTISGGTITASSSYHEGIESKSELYVTGGTIYATAADDALNSASDMYLKGGYIFARSTGTSTGADGIDANGNMYIQGATVYSIAHGEPDVAFDANSESNKKLYVESGTIVAISGMESGASLTQSCYQTSYSKGVWYGLYSNDTLALAFQVPSSGTMGSTMVVSTAGTTTLKSGITVNSGTQLWDGYGYIDATVDGGSSVSLSSYTGGGGFGPGGQPGGGGGGPGGGGFGPGDQPGGGGFGPGGH